MNQQAFEASLKPGLEVRLRWQGTSVPATIEKINKSSVAVRVKKPIGNVKAGERIVVSLVCSGRWSAAKCVRPLKE